METTDKNQYIIANLGEEHYGIEIKYIESIIVMQNITRIPKSQAYYKGVVNLRGEIVPVMSLRNRLGKEDEDYTGKTRIIIVRPEHQSTLVGIIVDEVKEVINLDTNDIDRINSIEDESDSFSIGIGKYNETLINILNVISIVNSKDKKK